MITPKEARELWVQALRSGKYEQTTAKLRGDGNERCCLGVACDVYAEQFEDAEGEGPRWMAEGPEAHFNPGGRKQTDGMTLPAAVMRFLGLTSHDGEVPEKNSPTKQHTSLAELNDDDMSFSEIADLIEQGKVVTKREPAS